MKMLILFVGVLAIVLNTVIGLVISGYSVLNFLSADLSLALSFGLLYFVVCGKMKDGFKIGLSSFFVLTGIARFLCAALIPHFFENNVLIPAVAGILFMELTCVAVALLLSKNK